MGLFGWHKCTANGCEVTLFVPLFAAPQHAGDDATLAAEWEAYERARAEWHTTTHGYGERCPAHREVP